MHFVRVEQWPCNRNEFTALIARHDPTVFRGLASTWFSSAAGRRSDPVKWLARAVGDRPVPFSVGLPGDAGFVGTRTIVKGKALGTTLESYRPLRALLREIYREVGRATGHAIYLQSLEVAKYVPELLPKLQLDVYGSCTHRAHWRLWLGTGQHRVNMHYDSYENFYCVLAGRKRFTLCPFHLISDAYVGPLDGGPYNVPASIVDPLRPDLNKFPRFREILDTAEAVDLEAGDVLYLPAHWWHFVESFGLNMSANLWWLDIEHDAVVDAEATLLRALKWIRPLPPHWREYCKTILDTFVFRVHGDPYAHLPVDEQGVAGEPTSRAVETLTRHIEEAEAQRAARLADAPELRRQHRVASEVAFIPADEHRYAVRRGGEADGTHVPASVLPVVGRFTLPTRPIDLLNGVSEAGQPGALSRRQQLHEALLVLIDQHILVPCD